MNFGSSFAYVPEDDSGSDVEVDETVLDQSLSTALAVDKLDLANDEKEVEESASFSDSDDDDAQGPLPPFVPSGPGPASQRSGGIGGRGRRGRRRSHQKHRHARRPKPAAKKGGGGIFGRLSSLFAASNTSAEKQPAAASNYRRKEKKKKKIRAHHADTNVVALSFASLKQDVDKFCVGDPVTCENCPAVLSTTSKLQHRKPSGPAADQNTEEKKADAPSSAAVLPDPAVSEKADAPAQPPANDVDDDIVVVEKPLVGELLWECEFCGHENLVDLDEEEIPSEDTRDFIMAPAPAKADDSKDSDNDGAVIFCVDTSGSMCVTKEVPGKLVLKGKKESRDAFGDLGGMVVPPQNRNTTWVSRLQCMQVAIEKQLTQWKKENPQRKVGVVTFNNEVAILGDGVAQTEIVAGDKLKNEAELQAIAEKHAIADYKPISESCDKLVDKLYDLQETGPTALGPALLMSLTMASKVPGSRVVVATDGLANVGLGSLDTKDDEERQKVEEWYEGIGNLAKLHGVTVSVVSIKGDECALEDLGRVAELSGGDVERMDPLELTTNFSSLLAKPIIAYQVQSTFLVHKGLKFRNENQEVNQVVRDVGNVTEDTEVSFEYTVKSKKHLKVFKHLKALPFQVQIRYTRKDGMKCLRVLSKAQPITFKRAQAEKNLRMELLAAHAAKQSAELAEVGDYERARVRNRMWGGLMARNVQQSAKSKKVFSKWIGASEQYDQVLHRQQNVMESAMDDEDFELQEELQALSVSPSAAGAAAPAPAAAKALKAKKKKLQRKAKTARSDADYSLQHKFKNLSSAGFL